MSLVALAHILAKVKKILKVVGNSFKHHGVLHYILVISKLIKVWRICKETIRDLIQVLLPHNSSRIQCIFKDSIHYSQGEVFGEGHKFLIASSPHGMESLLNGFSLGSDDGSDIQKVRPYENLPNKELVFKRQIFHIVSRIDLKVVLSLLETIQMARNIPKVVNENSKVSIFRYDRNIE